MGAVPDDCAAYDAEAAHRFWRVLIQADRILKLFRIQPQVRDFIRANSKPRQRDGHCALTEGAGPGSRQTRVADLA